METKTIDEERVPSEWEAAQVAWAQGGLDPGGPAPTGTFAALRHEVRRDLLLTPPPLRELDPADDPYGAGAALQELPSRLPVWVQYTLIGALLAVLAVVTIIN